MALVYLLGNLGFANVQTPAIEKQHALDIARARWLIDRLHIIYLGGGAMAAGLTVGLLLTTPAWTVWAWGAVALAYFLGCRKLNANARQHAIETHTQARRWNRYAIAASVFQGLKWGAAAWLFLDPTQPAQALLVLGVLVSVVAGAMLVMASHPRCYATLAVLIMTPLLVRLLEAGSAHWVLALLLAGSAGVGVYLVLDTARGLLDGFAMQIEHQQLAKSLATAVERAEAAVHARDELLAYAGHDLRTPIVALELLANDLTQRTPPLTGAALAHHHQHLRNELRELSSLLDTLLDLSAQGPDAPIEPQAIAVGPMLDAAVARFNPLARVHNVELRHLPTARTAHADPLLLRRMLDNLITNAIRHTPGGRVVLLARRAGDGVRLEVRDSGSGIPKSQHRSVFQAHRSLDAQPDPLLRRKGLGLAIVQQMAEQSGAQLSLRSEPGRGTVISLTLPAGSPSALTPAVAPEAVGRQTA